MKSVFAVWSLGIMIAFSQTQERSTILDRALDQRGLQTLLGRETTVDQVRTIPMEGTIDPGRYIVGPSDLVNVALWGPVTISYPLSVTPEGTLIIPTIGEVAVAHSTLAAVKREISSVVKRRYPSSNVTVTLLRPRSFVVTLRGNVVKPGQYVATAADRVEKVVTEGAEIVYPTSTFTIPAVSSPDGEPNKIESVDAPTIKRNQRFPDETSLRNILLVRKNGDTVHVDLPKFYATGNDRFNPFLLDGDIIFVSRKNKARDFVTVQGAVNLPGDVEYVEGDGLLDVIAIAGGMTGTADPANVLISRVDAQGRLAEEQILDVKQIMKGAQSNPIVERGDRIVVKEQPMLLRHYEVTVSGEVRLPGVYPITMGDTKLSKIIRDCGGFTEHALLSGSFILRKEGKSPELLDQKVELQRALRTHQLGLVDSTLFIVALKTGRQPVVADFKRLFEEGDTTQDVVLRKDDIIVVASDLHSVLVQGQVASSGYIPFVPGADYLYYIQKAGGYSELADQGEVKVVKKGTLEWVDPEKTTIESGDEIWVPKTPKKDFPYYFTIIRDAAQIAAALVSIAYLVVAIQSLSK